MASAMASLVRGPVAMTASPSGISVSSRSSTSTFGQARRRCVMYSEKPSLSTASAPPAATRFLSADSMMREPRRRISSLSRPAALSTRAALRELEQISSAKSGLWCAGEYFCGFISQSSTCTPALGAL